MSAPIAGTRWPKAGRSSAHGLDAAAPARTVDTRDCAARWSAESAREDRRRLNKRRSVQDLSPPSQSQDSTRKALAYKALQSLRFLTKSNSWMGNVTVNAIVITGGDRTNGDIQQEVIDERRGGRGRRRGTVVFLGRQG